MSVFQQPTLEFDTVTILSDRTRSLKLAVDKRGGISQNHRRAILFWLYFQFHSACVAYAFECHATSHEYEHVSPAVTR